MISSRLGRDPQVSAKKGGAKFPDELLCRISVIAEPFTQDTRQTRRVA